MTGARIAVVADVHLGEDQGSKLGSAAEELLPAVLEEIERAEPDLLVDLGDRLNAVDPEVDARNLRTVARLFEGVGLPRVHLLGNHDIEHLSAADHEAILGQPLHSHARDLHGWRLVFWNPDCAYTPGEGRLRLSEHDLAWLDAELADRRGPTVLFSHVPAHPASMDGNLYFEGRPASRAWHANVEEATRLLERHRQVVACVNGHTHWNALAFRDAIAFATLPSLTESFTTPPHPSGAWALLELDDDMALTVHGRDPCHWRLPLRLPRPAWLRNHPPTSRRTGADRS